MEAAAVHDAAQQQAQATSELSTARALIGVSSGVSFVTALAMVLCFSVFQESRRCGRRLLFCLHLADAGAACAWLLVFWLPPEAPDNANAGGDVLSGTEVTSSLVSTSASSSPTCYAQAYLLLFFMLASCLWTACFAFHLFQILGRQGKTTTPELYERRYHLVAWGVPLLTVVHLGLQQALGYDLVGESGLPWCWVRTWSDFEWAVSGVYIQLSVFYTPLLLILLHNLTTYLLLLYKMTAGTLAMIDALNANLDVAITAKRRDLQQDGGADLRAHGRVQLRVLLRVRLGLRGSSLPGDHARALTEPTAALFDMHLHAAPGMRAAIVLCHHHQKLRT